MDGDYNKEKEYPPLGAHNTKEYDEQYGRWWFERKDSENSKPRFQQSGPLTRTWVKLLIDAVRRSGVRSCTPPSEAMRAAPNSSGRSSGR